VAPFLLNHIRVRAIFGNVSATSLGEEFLEIVEKVRVKALVIARRRIQNGRAIKQYVVAIESQS